MASSDLSARVWAGVLDMGNALFKDLPIGAKFSFNRDGEVLIKTSARWYRQPSLKRTFTTGARTAVFTRKD